MHFTRSKLSITCNECGKEIIVYGHWYNQVVMEHFFKCKDFWHHLVYHRKKLSKYAIKQILKDCLLWIPLAFLQVIDWPYEIVGKMFYWGW